MSKYTKAARRMKQAANAAKWNAKNKQKVNQHGSIIDYDSQKTSKKSTKKKSKTGQVTQSKNPHKMNDKAKKAFYKAWTDYKMPRAMLGFWDGITSATVGKKMFTDGNKNIDTKKLYQSGSYKIGNIGGNMAGYGFGYGSVGKAAGKAATKVVTSQTGKRLVSKAAKTKLMKSAARKTLTKAGQNATTKAIEHAAKKQAGNVAKGLVKGAVADATVGTFMNSQSARAEGMKVGSKEWKKHMAESAVLDFAIGGAVEIAPTTLKALKKDSGKKTVQRVVDGKVKNVKVDKSYTDFAQVHQKNALNKSKKAVETARNEYTAAKNKLSKAQSSLQSKSTKRTENLANLNEMRQKKLAAAERNFKQAELKLEKKQQAYDNAMKATLPEPKASVRKQAPLPKSFNEAKQAKLKANTDSFMNQVSRVMMGEYNERLPLKVSDTPAILKKYGAKSSKITMPSKNVRKIAYPAKYLGQKDGHNLGFEALQQLPKQISDPVAILDSFTQPNSRVIITNIIDTNNNPVLVALHLNKNGQLSVTDEIASMYGKDGFNSFIERARKEGKVLYENKKTGLNDAVTSRLQLSGDATSSDPIFSISKNAENVNEIKKRPQYQVSSNNAIGREDSYLSAGKSSDNSIPDSSVKSNTKMTSEELVDALKDADFLKYVQEKSGGNVPEMAKSNGISVNEQTERLYKEYVLNKDLGADIYKHSTKDLNAKRYGIDNGVPNATPYGETSQAAKTLYNSDIMDSAAKSRLLKDINEGLHAKYTVTNKTVIDDAKSLVKEDITKARNSFDSIMEEGKQATSADIAKGYILADEYIKRGDYDSLSKVLADVSAMESEAGRTLQASKIFKNLTPEGKVTSAARQVTKLEKATGQTIEIPKELYDELLNAKTEADAYKAARQIAIEAHNQIPPGWSNKVNSWRYMAMLLNPKTHIKNILGNALFVPVKNVKNVIATGMEKAVLRNGGRTTSILNPFSGADRSLVNAGKEDFKAVKETLMNGTSKYLDNSRPMESKVFDNKVLEFFRRLSGDSLEKEDEFFIELSYRNAYAKYLKAQGIRNIDDASEDILRMAREYASEDALKSTYRDANVLSDQLAKFKKYANTPLNRIPGEKTSERVLKKAGSMALDVTVPFTKTPINIIRRGFDYSPVGLIRGMGKIVSAKGDVVKLAKAIDDVAAGLTGSGIMLVGGYMGAKGLAQGELDTTTNEGKFREMNGEQSYSIKIGDYTYTMDWAAPMSMPFFVGVEAGSHAQKNGMSPEQILPFMSKITDPVFNLSMLSSLNNVLDVAFGGGNSTLSVLQNMAEAGASQMIPSLFSNIAKTITPEKKSTTSTNSLKEVRGYETFFNSMKNKVPGLNLTNPAYVNNWGETEEKKSLGDYGKAIFDNFLNPGSLKKTRDSSVDKEIYNLGDRLGEFSDIVPKSTKPEEYDKKFDGVNYHMSEHDLTLYKKAKGRYSQQGLQELFSTKKYQNMSDVEKKQAIKKVYDAAKDKATMEFLMDKGISKEKYKVAQMGKNQKKAYEKSGMDIDRFETLYKARDNYVDSDGSVTKTMKLLAGGAETYKEANAVFGGELSEHAYKNAKNLYNLGIKPKEVRKIAKGADSDGNKHYSTAELVAYLDKTSYSRYEKAYIFAALANWNAHNPYA